MAGHITIWALAVIFSLHSWQMQRACRKKEFALLNKLQEKIDKVNIFETG
jgi:cytochrome oxidase assembly protein ShyY1